MRLKLYYRLAKPGIVYGNLLSTVGAFLLAANGTINLYLLLATVLGTGLIIGSACVFNNYIDRDIDAHMERTKERALASKKIPTANALIFGAALGLIGSAILIQFVNILTLVVGLLGFVWYVFIYTYSKRVTHHSTLIGTIAGSTPPVAGYVAVTNQLDMGAFILFLVLTFWQMPHFYAIAILGAKGYAAAKIPVLPLVRSINRTKIEAIAYMIAFLLTVPLLSFFGYAGASYALIMVLFSIVWLRTAMEDFNSSSEVIWAKNIFRQSLVVLLVFCLALSLNPYLP